MAGPASPEFLQSVYAGMSPDPRASSGSAPPPEQDQFLQYIAKTTPAPTPPAPPPPNLEAEDALRAKYGLAPGAPSANASAPPPTMSRAPVSIETSADRRPPPQGEPIGEPLPVSSMTAVPLGRGRRGEVSTIGPKAAALYQMGHGEDLEAVQSGSLMRSLQAQHEADMFEDAARREQSRQEAYQRVAEDRQAELDGLRSNLEAKANELGEAHMDPDRLWKNKPLWNKIGTGISLVLGGIADGFAGKESRALQVWQRQIDRDIEAQKFDYQAKSNSVDATKSAFYEAMNAYKTREVAEGVARAASYKHLENMIQAEGVRRGDMESRARAEALTHQLKGEHDRLMASLLRMISQGPSYALTVNGQTSPVPHSLKQVQDAFTKFAAEPGTEVRKGVVLEGAKANATQLPQDRKHIADQLAKDGTLPLIDLVDKTARALGAAKRGAGEREFDLATSTMDAGARETLRKALYGKEVSEREQAWGLFTGQYVRPLAGAHMAPNEVNRYIGPIEGTGDTESRLFGLKQVTDYLESRAAQHGAANPRAYHEVRSNFKDLRAQDTSTRAPGGFVPHKK